MLPKKNRVNKKNIEEIFKKSKFINSPNITLKFIIKDNINNFCISFITPKTISKKALDRNLLRRRGYFVFKKYSKSIPNGFFGIFIFNKKSFDFFGGKKKKDYNPLLNLDTEIKYILNKL